MSFGMQPRLLKEIDECKEKTQKVEDKLNKVNDDLSHKIEAEQKEVSLFLSGVFIHSIYNLRDIFFREDDDDDDVL